MTKLLSSLVLILSTVGLSTFVFILYPFYRNPNLMHSIQKLWARIFLISSGVKVIVKTKSPELKGPFVIMSNHQSALDIFVLLASLPFPFRFVAKRELFLIPFLGWAMRCVGHIRIDRENLRESMKALEEAAERVKSGLSILIFPEGTRSETGRLLPFKRGAFHILRLVSCPVLPVGIYGTNSIMPRGTYIPRRKGEVYVSIGEPLNLSEFWTKEKERVIETVKETIQTLIDEGKREGVYGI